jgi:hypothetical protein
VVDRAMRRHHEQENRMKREKAEEARRRRESWAAWVPGKIPRWMLALWVDTRVEQKQQGAKRLREEELALLKRASELGNHTADLLSWIKEMLRDRMSEARSLNYHVDEDGVQSVLNGSTAYRQHLHGLAIIVSRYWEEEVVKRGRHWIKRANNTL